MAFNQFPSKGGIPSGNTAGRPSNPVIGDTYYNGQLELLEIYNGTGWVANSAPPATPTVVSVTDTGTGLAYATGGTFTVVVAAGSGGATPLQYGAVTDSGGFSASSSGTTITMSGLTSGVAFAVSANASNNFGTTVNSSPFNVVTATTVPQAPTIGTATTSSVTSDVTVSWTLNSNGGKNLSAITITPYLNGTTAQTSQTAATTSSTTHTFTGLTMASAYTFKVKTTNANGAGLESLPTNSITVPSFRVVEYLSVAGGGAGGGRTVGGGGGAGGMLTGSFAIQAGVTITCTVGGGGSGSASPPTNGTTSSIAASGLTTITSSGGGRGGSYSGSGLPTTGANGGSGGGGGDTEKAGGTGISGQGNNGGTSGPQWSGAGGGGAGAVGASATTAGVGANGGVGVSSSITGTATFYAGGGGGCGDTSGGSGGSGGGGSGGYGVTNPAQGVGSTNTGGGGGGSRDNTGGGTGGMGYNGGSGVVIVRATSAAVSTTGSPTVTTSGGYTIYKFTGDGTITY